MTQIGITGAQGFLGWHFRCFLYSKGIQNPRLADRKELSSPEGYARFVKDCDVIVHFAGMARGDSDTVAKTNIDIAEELIRALDKTDKKPHIVYASSIQIANDSPYGTSKRRAGELFEAWSARTGGKFANLILPNLFGEGGKPFYNSVVATFCHQIALEQTPTILQDSEVSFLHVQSVCDLIWAAIENGASGTLRPDGTHLRVSELLAEITDFHRVYTVDGIIPEFKDPFRKALFNTYRSFLFESKPQRFGKLHTDPRGSLCEIVKTRHGGQAFYSTTYPGITRGDHYHRHKLERFAVIGGEAVIRIRKLFSESIAEFRVSGDEPAWIDIPTLHTHNITNIGSGNLFTLFWSDEIFDPGNPDTYPEKVAKPI